MLFICKVGVDLGIGWYGLFVLSIEICGYSGN